MKRLVVAIMHSARAFAIVVALSRALLAQSQTTQSELRGPLEIVHPIETVADLQRELNYLEARLANVDGLLAENAKSIYGGTSQALNGAAEAVLGPIFGRTEEYETIQKNLVQAAAAAQGSAAALAQAQAALKAGQTSVAVAKTEEAVALAREAQTNSKAAYDQTVEIFKRANSVLTGEMSPQQLKELAQRYWESRKDLKDAAKGLLTYASASKEHDLLIALRHELTVQVDQLTDLKARQAFAPQTPIPQTLAPQVPPVQLQPPPEGPSPVMVDGPATHPIQTAGNQAGNSSGGSQNQPDPEIVKAIDTSLQNPITLSPLPENPAGDQTQPGQQGAAAADTAGVNVAVPAGANSTGVTQPAPTGTGSSASGTGGQPPTTTDNSGPLPNNQAPETGDVLARALNNMPGGDSFTQIPEIPASQCNGIPFCNGPSPTPSQDAASTTLPATPAIPAQPIPADSTGLSIGATSDPSQPAKVSITNPPTASSQPDLGGNLYPPGTVQPPGGDPQVALVTVQPQPPTATDQAVETAQPQPVTGAINTTGPQQGSQATVSATDGSTTTGNTPDGSLAKLTMPAGNYICQSGPCTLEQWQQESSAFPSPQNYTCPSGPCTLDQWIAGTDQASSNDWTNLQQAFQSLAQIESSREAAQRNAMYQKLLAALTAWVQQLKQQQAATMQALAVLNSCMNANPGHPEACSGFAAAFAGARDTFLSSTPGSVTPSQTTSSSSANPCMPPIYVGSNIPASVLQQYTSPGCPLGWSRPYSSSPQNTSTAAISKSQPLSSGTASSSLTGNVSSGASGQTNTNSGQVPKGQARSSGNVKPSNAPAGNLTSSPSAPVPQTAANSAAHNGPAATGSQSAQAVVPRKAGTESNSAAEMRGETRTGGIDFSGTQGYVTNPDLNNQMEKVTQLIQEAEHVKSKVLNSLLKLDPTLVSRIATSTRSTNLAPSHASGETSASVGAPSSLVGTQSQATRPTVAPLVSGAANAASPRGAMPKGGIDFSGPQAYKTNPELDGDVDKLIKQAEAEAKQKKQ